MGGEEGRVRDCVDSTLDSFTLHSWGCFAETQANFKAANLVLVAAAQEKKQGADWVAPIA